jgi:hypothetical protein
MKRAYFIIFIIAIFSSCDDKNPIVGTWIEQNNFTQPAIYEIGQDYYRILNGPISGKRLYKLKKDTFMFDNFLDLEKIRFEVKENELLFYSANNDSLLSKFERNVYRNFIDYFNVKKNTTVMLPIIESKQIRWEDNINTFVFDNENGYSIYFNGENIKLDNSTYLKLFTSADDYLHSIDNNLIFCNSRVKLEELNKLKIQLQKARRNRITYVTQDSSNNLLGLRVILPYVESDVPDSILSKYPPPPPPPTFDFENFHSENILCKIDNMEKELNGEKIQPDKLYSIINRNITSIKGFTVHVYFDEKMDFESYLIELTKLREVYYSVRDKYAEDLYNEFRYENLEPDEQKKIRKIYPLRIREINKNEYEKIKKYAL